MSTYRLSYLLQGKLMIYVHLLLVWTNGEGPVYSFTSSNLSLLSFKGITDFKEPRKIHQLHSVCIFSIYPWCMLCPDIIVYTDPYLWSMM